MSDERCVHDLVRAQCALCRPPASQPAPPDRAVWILPTSEVFHRRDCYMFDATHEANLVTGRTDSEPTSLTVADAVERRLRPCTACSPDVR